tara:strand:- start:833 stop:1063 length:231 start_codon:yes stop_codon:yes gene_type:complete
MGKTLMMATALCLAWQLAIAGDTSFNELDANADGLITSDEAQADAKVVEVFGALDVNGDGFLTLAEYSAIETSRGG